MSKRGKYFSNDFEGVRVWWVHLLFPSQLQIKGLQMLSLGESREKWGGELLSGKTRNANGLWTKKLCEY